MMIAYLIGILVSAGVTIYMFDRFLKKQKKKNDEDEEKEIEQEAKDIVTESLDQRAQDKLMREQVKAMLQKGEIEDSELLEKLKLD